MFTKSCLGLAVVLSFGLGSCTFVRKFTDPKGYACEQHFEKLFAEKSDHLRDQNLYDYETFFSKELNTCITAWQKKTGVDFAIQDLTQDYLQWPKASLLFHCDQAGVDSIIRSAVEKLKGQVWELTYSSWLDNAEGGEPRTLKTPPQPYTQERCEKLFEKKLSEYR